MAAQRAIEMDRDAPGLCSCSIARPNSRPRVQVCDDIPIFRETLSVELSQHGLEVVQCEPLEAADAAATDLTVCGVAVEDDWATLEELLSDGPVFVVVPEPFEDNEVRALRSGAAGVARRGAPSADIVTAICAVPRGYMVIDQELLAKMCSGLAPEPPFELDPHERQLLKRLGEGTTIVALAAEFGYSSRDMHRTMRRLYDRMDVPNLYQALIVATRFGLLD